MEGMAKLLRLAGSVLVGQLAVIGFGVADTVMLGRGGDPAALGALALGQAIYITLSISLGGVLQALLPVLARAHGAGDAEGVARGVRQGLWLALGLSLLGLPALLWPQPLLALSGSAAPPGVGRYLMLLALSLPATLALRVHAALGQAVGLPNPVTLLQSAGLALKLLLNALLLDPRAFHLSASGLGVDACALASTVALWVMVAAAGLQHRWIAELRSLRVLHAWEWPSWRQQRPLLRLGLPTGFSLAVEVSAFTLMALFVARFGDVQLAGHQIAASYSAMVYMVPMSMAIATSSITAQWLGADQPVRARRAAWSGIGVSALFGLAISATTWFGRGAIVSLYTPEPAVQAVARGLFGLIAAYQVFDAVQSGGAFVLRAYHVAILPSVLFAIALWGVGLGGGYVLAFGLVPGTPAALHGAAGFWCGNATGLAIVALAFAVLLRRHAAAPARGAH